MAEPADTAGIRFPPPLVFLGLLLAGIATERAVGGVSFGVDRTLLAAAGGAVAVGGGVLIAIAAGLFRRAGTRPEPWQPTTAIVTRGPYRFTRNPMYLGMALVHSGLAVALDAPVALILLAPALWIVDREVIAREERYLEARFGEPYRAYKASVRRWL